MPYWKWTTKVSITPCTEVSPVRLFFFFLTFKVSLQFTGSGNHFLFVLFGSGAFLEFKLLLSF